MSALDLTPEEFELVLFGLGSLTHDRRYSPNRQHEAQLLAKKLWAIKEPQMSEPILEDDHARGYGDVCENCDEMAHFCVCGEPDTMEEAAFEK